MSIEQVLFVRMLISDRRFSKISRTRDGHCTGVSGLPRSERQNLTVKVWRFKCSCKCCEFSGREAEESDVRRQFIGRVDDLVGQLPAQNMIRLVQRALDFLEKEELFGTPRARVCYDGYQLACQMENLDEAEKLIKMGI